MYRAFDIPFEDIKQATKDFDEEHAIEMGGFGKAYKGELLRPDGNVVTCVFQEVEVDPSGDPDIVLLNRYQHENIVSFLGCNLMGAKHFAVFVFPTHGSLDKYLSSAKLTWLNRLQICLGAAQGLDYIHNHRRDKICHGNIRCANILLDKNWQAKITYPDISMISTDTVSDMEWYHKHRLWYDLEIPTFTSIHLTKESDIYSFGMVLFEVVCGRLAVMDEEDIFLGPLARQHHQQGTITNIIDPILRNQMDQDSLNTFSTIAYQCLEDDPSKRPRMTQIVNKLKEVLQLQNKFEMINTLALQQIGEAVKERPPDEDDYSMVGEAVKERPPDEDDYYMKNNLEHWKIPFQEIHSATNKFHPNHCIGRGGFGGVYKAELFHFDVRKYLRREEPHRSTMVDLYGYPRRKSKVAVKRLDRQSGQGKEEFLQEIKVLCRLNHENLVSLLGFCDEKGEMMLVYQYASNGSLDKWIHKGDSPTWQKRLQICLDIAHGLNYLHKHNIQHRDIKSANILLDHNWVAMIADLGLSRIRKHENSDQLSKTNVVGTLFYADPKYVRTGILSKQSDIYSLGVILLEVLFGRLALPPRLGDDPEYIVHVAERHFHDKQILIQHIDPHLRAELEKSCSTTDKDNLLDSINTFVDITYQCLHCTQDDTHRQLTMEKVLEELKRALIFHSTGLEALSLEAINNATNCFSEERVIGKGASGKVYIGELSLSNGPKLVAMKRLKMGDYSYGEGAFLKDVAKLSSYIHGNIIPLRGFCEEGHEKIIILDHAIKGSLDKHLDKCNLTWGLRLKISIATAKGLHYIHTQHTLHGDIKSSNILLHHDWKATISDFIISQGRNLGTLGYVDPLPFPGGQTKESDVYSFGVILFELLSGTLAFAKVGKYPQRARDIIINADPQSKKTEETRNIDDQVVFLAQVAARCIEDHKLEAIIFDGIKEQTDAKSIYTLADIAYQCLRREREKRPTMAQVLKALENASKIHEEWESEKSLPRDYDKIIKMARNPSPSSLTKKDLYSLLCSGILLEKEKVWFSISTDGVVNEMVPAKMFSYNKVSYLKWRSNKKSRFSKVAQILDISNFNIRIQTRIQFLTSEMMYGAYLVFMFCNQRKVSSRPLYVNLKYKKEGETLNAYYAEWKAGSNWLKVELFRIFSDKGSIDVDILLEGFSQYYCGSGGIFVEGIEFQPIRRVDFEDRLKDGKNMGGGVLKSDLDMDLIHDYNEIIKRSTNDVQNASKEELYFLLSKGILIDNGEKLFSLSKVKKKMCHMLPAKAVLHNYSSNVKFCTPPTESRSRFGEVAKVLSHCDIHIKYDIETQLLSSHTTYACYLVFKLSERCRGLKCPVKARDLVPANRKKRTHVIAFTSPTIVNLDKIKWIPNEREDGWMEVIVWETINDHSRDEYVSMDLKLISFEGTMSGLIVYGIEFRPI